MNTYQIKDLKLTARLICEEMISRGIEVEVISHNPSLVRYKIDGDWHFLHSTIGERDSALASTIASDKFLSAKVFEIFGWKHPDTALYSDESSLVEFLESNQTIVIKPLDGAHGNGVSVNISSLEGAKAAIEKAKILSNQVLLQRMVSGDDYRLLCVGGKFVAAMKRTPASVVGDGRSTILELIESENRNPRRGSDNYEKPMVKISVERAREYVGADKMNSVPEPGERVRLSAPANISLGGTATDVTDHLPSEMVEVAKDVSSKLKAGACGVDFMWDGASQDFYLIEVNTNPGIGNHDMGYDMAKPRGAAKAIVDYLLEGGDH